MNFILLKIPPFASLTNIMRSYILSLYHHVAKEKPEL